MQPVSLILTRYTLMNTYLTSWTGSSKLSSLSFLQFCLIPTTADLYLKLCDAGSMQLAVLHAGFMSLAVSLLILFDIS